MSIFDIFDKISKENPETAAGTPEFIICGLGNPGSEYERTRHNAGFMTVDALAKKYSFEIKKLKFKSLTAVASINGVSCLVMKPSTFMNNSGEAVVEAMNFYKIPIENVIICYDDISLEPSKLRIRRKGSDGGQKGLRSIIDLVGSQDFTRIKIGIGNKPNPEYNLADWVLSRFTDNELETLDTALNNAASAAVMIAGGNIDRAMNKYNS